jgi:predicted PurR-regulated permease PerM
MLWDWITTLFSPFVIGATLAFIINVPMRAIERHLGFIKQEGLRRTASIILTLVAVVFVIYGVFALLVPQIGDTIMILIPKLTDFFLRMEETAEDFLQSNPQLLEWVYANTGFESFDWAGLIQQAATVLKNSVTAIASGALSAFGSIASALVNAVIGLVFSLYCLARKEILARQGRKLLYSFVPERVADEIIRVLRLTNSTFSNFISGQCLEAVILGCLFAVSMAIFGMPYIPLISVLIGVTALVPIVGAFVGCILGAFFILVSDPFQAVLFVAMFLVLQQIEGNLIYPKVVGTSIGLPGMWVLVAVTVGGEVMGIAGMLVMIPLASVCYTLLREFTTKRVEEREIDPEKLKAHPPELKNQFKENRERREQIKFRREMKRLAEKHKEQLRKKRNHE